MRNFAILLVLFCVVVLGNANVINPSFDGAPAGGWVTDRYQPNVFADIGSFQGRSDVLQIGIDSAQGMGSRPGAYSSQFYNTQGMKYSFGVDPTGVGSIISADLWIPEEWRYEQNGSRRTDMWATMENAGSAISAYPIIGFSNYGGVSTFRAWDGLGWVNFIDPVNYGAWNTLAIKLAASTFEYYVNGNLAFTDNDTGNSVRFRDVMFQSYNFNGDGSLSAVTAGEKGNYSTHWSKTVAGEPVPEPGTVLLSGLGLLALGLLRRRQQQKQ